ncbi:MAG TPA: DUF4215 domain-containing protein [Kofleriaceae bacterium]|nr:DUF4215 domain-containing protein [Kofleriaceae bacterium]
MGARGVVCFAAATALACGGCLHDDLVACGNMVCPAGKACAPGGGCVDPDQLTACDGLQDGDPCTPASGAPGTCRGGVCVQFCGDGIVEAGEQCDDGNSNPADGCDACVLTSWVPTVLAGGNLGATMLALEDPHAATIDFAGRLYIADTIGQRVRRVDTDGTMITIAGTGVLGRGGDGGPATAAQLAYPTDVAVDGLGNAYIVDSVDSCIRRVDTDGTISTFAGVCGSIGDAASGAPAISPGLTTPSNLTLDPQGRIVIADTDNSKLRRVELDGTITTIAGTGGTGSTGDGGLATSAQIGLPYDLAYDSAGRLVFADMENHVVRRIDTTGKISTIAGTGSPGSTGDNGPATSAELDGPQAVATDAAGNVYIADTGNNRVRRIDPGGTITTIAGTGAVGFAGDGGPATSAVLDGPEGVVVDLDGRVVIVDSQSNRVRRIATDGTIATFAGSDRVPGDGLAATSVALGSVAAPAFDPQGRVAFFDSVSLRVRRIELDGTLSTIAGNGVFGYTGDGGPATSASLGEVSAMVYDSLGGLVIADSAAHVVRHVDSAGTITTIAGTGVLGNTGDGGPAISARLHAPSGVAIDGMARVLISDSGSHSVRRIDTAGVITTIAGTGTPGSSGDGGPATSAQLDSPAGVTVDAQGLVIIADSGNYRIRRIDASGNISTIAGTGAGGFSGDGGAATSAKLNDPCAPATDPQGRLVFADAGNSVIRRIDATGVITTIAGTSALGFSGDGGPATAALLAVPIGLAIDGAGDIVIADAEDEVVREIGATGTIVTTAGQVEPDSMGPVAVGRFADPVELATASGMTFAAGGTSGTVQLEHDGAAIAVVAGRYPQQVATAALARFRTDQFGDVGGIAYDASANQLYVAETTANRLDVVTIVDATDPDTWTIAPLAGTGSAGFRDGSAATAMLAQPSGLYLDTSAHVLYIADRGNDAIRALDLGAMMMSTIAGTPTMAGNFGDGGPALQAALYRPSAIAKCSNGDLFIADTGNERVRRVDATGTITTVLGDGSLSSAGDGAPASTFPVDTPLGVSCDVYGNVMVTSTASLRLLAADDNGTVDGTGAVHTIYGGAGATSFPANATSCLTGVAVVDSVTLRLVDSCTGLLLQLVRM